MSESSNRSMGSPSKIALSLIVLSAVAVVVGLFNLLSPKETTSVSDSPESKKEDSAIISAIADIAKGDQLMYVELSGPIMMQAESNNVFGANVSNAVKARKALEAAVEDDHVKGVLLGINSPGGTVGMSQELNAVVTRLAKKKPVVAYFGDMAASGGYYTGCAATKIVSNPGTITASIGVIISTLNFKDLMQDKLGVKAYTIKSGKFKDILNPYRDATEQELAMIQDMIDVSYGQFLGAVIEGRTRYIDDPVKKAAMIKQITAVADGRIVIGEQALKVGLVDELGDIDHAHNLLSRMAKERFKIKGKDRLELQPYKESSGLMDIIGFVSNAPAIGQNMVGQPWVEALSVMPLSWRYSSQPLWILE